MNMENCTCSLTTGCGEYDEAGCPACRAADVYLPCPVFGFMCWPPIVPGRVCACCTPDQQEMTRRFHDHPSPQAGGAPLRSCEGASPDACVTQLHVSGDASNVP